MILVKLRFKKEPTLRKGRSGWRTTKRDGGGRRERVGQTKDGRRSLTTTKEAWATAEGAWTTTICERERVFVRESERETSL